MKKQKKQKNYKPMVYRSICGTQSIEIETALLNTEYYIEYKQVLEKANECKNYLEAKNMIEDFLKENNITIDDIFSLPENNLNIV